MPNLTGKTTTLEKISEIENPVETGVVLYGTNDTVHSSKIKLSSIFEKTVFSKLKTTAKNILDAINELKNGIDELNTDTGWINIIGTSIASADLVAPSVGTPVRYRKKGGVVYINGTFGLKNKVANTNKVLFTLPAGYRMSSGFYYFTNTSSGFVMSRYILNSNGQVLLEWIRKLTDGSEMTGDIVWASIDTSFPVE